MTVQTTRVQQNELPMGIGLDFIENLHANTIAIILAIGSIVGWTIRFFLKRRFAQREDQKFLEAERVASSNKELSESRKEFISAFDDALNRLHSQRQAAGGILKETISFHKVAYDKFRSTVKRLKGNEVVSGLDKAWNDCYGGNIPYAKFHNKKPGTREGEQEAKEYAIKKIQAILDFVNQL